MKVINKKLVRMLCILVVMLGIGIFLIFQKDTDKITLDEVKLKEPEKNSGMFAIMVQEAAGSETYNLYGEDTWPSSGYEFNPTKSGCLDSDGQKIEDVQLSFTDGKVIVETGNTSYCYIYFDIEIPRKELAKICKDKNMENCMQDLTTRYSEIQNLNNGNKGDLQYRYVGAQDQSSSINNYVCFGATTCSGEADNHLYRIIGITNGGQLKIQKNSAISTAQWWEDYSTDKSWADSKIYTSLKGSDFYESTTYVSQEMKNKIETEHVWNTGDVKSYNDGTTVYNAEYGTSETTHSHTGAVGLAYLSDYYFAYNDGGTQNCTSGNYCKSWMVPSSTFSLWKNKTYEWTMSRYGQNSSGAYYAWYVYLSGTTRWDYLTFTYAVRPVFYLNSSVTITGGEGTLKSPYIIN